jgi:hypothetical protein
MFSSKLPPRLRLLRWAVPLSLAVLVAVYQLGLARWILLEYGEQYHTLAEILFYGIGGPLLALLSLDFLIRWLEERETSELQSRILEETRANMAASRGLNDETLQTLYAVSIMLETLKSTDPDLPPEKAGLLREAESALAKTMARIRAYLQEPVLRKPGPTNGNRVPAFPSTFFKER